MLSFLLQVYISLIIFLDSLTIAYALEPMDRHWTTTKCLNFYFTTEGLPSDLYNLDIPEG